MRSAEAPWRQRSKSGCKFVSSCLLKGMGSVGTEHKLHLQEQFMGFDAFGIAGETVLPADLGELAGPVGEYGGTTPIVLLRRQGAVGPVKAATQEPATGQLILA